MGALSSDIIKAVKIESISADENGNTIFSGRTNSLTSLAKLLTSLEASKKFSSPKLTEVNFEQNGVISFNISAVFSFSSTETSNSSEEAE